MPEGHSVHRITRQFAVNFLDSAVSVSSPQGRFSAGASLIDGHVITAASAVGKQMFLEFDNGLWLRVHLGMYGAWDFSGDIRWDATIASSGRGSLGAPRRTRVRMAESEKAQSPSDLWPPEPVGQVRARLLTDSVCADLRGPTACEVIDEARVSEVIGRLGPDPADGDSAADEERFVTTVRRKPTVIALLLMDQSVLSGIGNVYRAELLYRARLNPHTPGRLVTDEAARGLWRDWVHLLRIGIETGQMMTIDGLDPDAYRAAMADRADRHWVYKREGLPCRTCGTNIVLEVLGGRKLYWCPRCQA